MKLWACGRRCKVGTTEYTETPLRGGTEDTEFRWLSLLRKAPEFDDIKRKALRAD